MRKKIIVLLTAILICTSMVACKKFIDIGNPKNQITTNQVFADSADASSVLTGIYVNMMNTPSLTFCSGGLTLYPGLSSDELTVSSTNVADNEFYANNLTTTNTVNTTFYNTAYKLIYATNACIEGVNASNGISAEAKKSIIGEARFIRSFLYFNLINLYGDVPLILSTNFEENRLKGRSNMDLVYVQIIDDLKFAEANLSLNTSVNQKPNLYAASALLAKVYLYNKKYDLAEAEAGKVLNSGTYSLQDDLNDVFLVNSTETIWQLQPVIPGYNTWEAYVFVPSSATGVPKYTIAPNLLNSFESGDNRKLKWIRSRTIKGINYFSPFKYKIPRNSGTPDEEYVVFRLAEQYLIRAEAQANLGNLSAANENMNFIRNRAGLSSLNITDKESLLSAISKERRNEMFCEWGNRWFDLKRSNAANAILGTLKDNWSTEDQLYPIPNSEIIANPNLVQNPGY